MGKKNKYDTDPLDPAVADLADQQWGAPPAGSGSPQAQPQPVTPGDQRPFAEAEGPTRLFDSPPKGYTAYPSVFEEQTPAAAPGTPPATATKKVIQRPTSRQVPGLNLAENITLILPYLPFYIGAVAAIIELFTIPRSEPRARFHASQGLALHIVALAIGGVLGFLSDFSGARVGGILFSILSTALFIYAIIRVWRGEPVHVAPADDFSNLLNEKINPRK